MILNFGSVNIDNCYQVRDFVRAGETISALEVTRHAGGKGFNQSVALARAGAKVCHAGCIGEDGLFLRDMLRAAGVDTDYLRVTDTPTGNAIIQVNSRGENCIILYTGANGSVTKDFADEVLERFGPEDLLLVTQGGILIRTAVENIRTAGRATQGVIVMRFKEEGDRVISLALADKDESQETETGVEA